MFFLYLRFIRPLLFSLVKFVGLQLVHTFLPFAPLSLSSSALQFLGDLCQYNPAQINTGDH